MPQRALARNRRQGWRRKRTRRPIAMLPGWRRAEGESPIIHQYLRKWRPLKSTL